MARTVVVEVTEEDIAKGVKRTCKKCPVARAFQRVTKSPVVQVGAKWMFTMDRVCTVKERGVIPPPAADFIDDFDNGRPVAPFTFTVELS